MRRMKIGVIREGKIPPDSRVALPPEFCRYLLDHFEIDLVVQKSPNRCYRDLAYAEANIPLVEEVGDCDILFGVKEVPIDQLIEGKTYFFFSHTHKEQPYNRRLLQELVTNRIKMVDYELLTNENGQRVIAFGRFAGLVGAHNGLMTWGKKTGLLDLPRANSFHDLEALKTYYDGVTIPPLKIVITGNGRVAKGAVEIMEYLKIKNVKPNEYLSINTPTEAIFVQLDSDALYEREDGTAFEFQHFYNYPSEYRSRFGPYTQSTDLMINAIYWDPEAPLFFTKEEMQHNGFGIKSIADITCDIEGSVPATLKATTIANPYMGYNPRTMEEDDPWKDGNIAMMTIDNLPNELPINASNAFGEQLVNNVIPQLLNKAGGAMIERATICENGNLTDTFSYLDSFIKGS